MHTSTCIELACLLLLSLSQEGFANNIVPYSIACFAVKKMVVSINIKQSYIDLNTI